MEKLIFFIILFAIVSAVESLSKKKDPGSGDAGESWDLKEFDFTKISAKPKQSASRSTLTLGMSEAETFSAEKQEHEVHRDERSYISSQKGTASVKGAVYIENTTQPADSVDAYSIDTSGKIVKAKKEALESSMNKVAFDIDAGGSLEKLAELSSAAAVINAEPERMACERRNARSARKAFRRQDSSVKSNFSEGESTDQTNIEDKVNESFDIKSMFSGSNIKKTILSSIILDKSKF